MLCCDIQDLLVLATFLIIYNQVYLMLRVIMSRVFISKVYVLRGILPNILVPEMLLLQVHVP